MSDLRLEIKGLKEMQQKNEQVLRDLKGAPFLSAMRDATLIVERSAKINVPVDTGRLRASITPEVRQRWPKIQGVVGSNVHHAAYVETGTRAHWPPPGALAVWARRHGMPEYLVRRSIGRFGTSMMALRTVGTKGWRYLQRALDDNRDKITRILGKAVGRIVNK